MYDLPTSRFSAKFRAKREKNTNTKQIKMSTTTHLSSVFQVSLRNLPTKQHETCGEPSSCAFCMLFCLSGRGASTSKKPFKPSSSACGRSIRLASRLPSCSRSLTSRPGLKPRSPDPPCRPSSSSVPKPTALSWLLTISTPIARTSNMFDRALDPLDRCLYAARYFHGHLMSAEYQIRAWAMLHNFHPYCPRAKIREQFLSPFHQLNGRVYHNNWLPNLLVSSSLGGRYATNSTR